MSLAGRLFRKSEHFAVRLEQLDVVTPTSRRSVTDTS
jgi:hypothetical protein